MLIEFRAHLNGGTTLKVPIRATSCRD